jgi:hypothetical protein
MEIWVEFANGKLSVSPETVRIPRGTSVTWRFRAEDPNYRGLRWTIYFRESHPFARPFDPGICGPFALNISVDTLPRDGQHAGASPAVSADEPGHYKYGVRLDDPAEGQELGDEDPYLIVY